MAQGAGTHTIDKGRGHGQDEGFATGWLHAELEYWDQGHRHQLGWRRDLMKHSHLPAAMWMIIPPHASGQLELPLNPAQPVLAILVSLISLVALTW